VIYEIGNIRLACHFHVIRLIILVMPFLVFLTRIEQVNIKSGHGVAKIAGTVATIAGATIITLYKGMTLTRDSEGTHKLKDINVITSPGFTWIAGCLIMFLNCLCLSGWMVLQVHCYYFAFC
jgi:hypothetical protein